MKLGTIVSFQNPARWRRPWQVVYEEGLAYAEASERLGFDEVWLTEHHFVDDGYCPALLPVAAAIAARTTTIRIGTKVLLLPLHDPVRVAEDAAVVDQLSGGRLDLGIAAGYRAEEFMGFGIERSERGARFAEALGVLRRALDGDSIAHDGRFYRYGDVRIRPPALQSPFPVWAGGRTETGLRRIARAGCHLQLADFSVERGRHDLAIYLDELLAAGHDPQRFAVDAVTTIFVDEDRERAWALAGEHLLYQQNIYRDWFAEAGDRHDDDGAHIASVAELRGSTLLVGTPDDVLATIREFHEAVPFTHLSVHTMLPGLALDVALPSLELFAGRVAPALRELAATATAR
jgi:alkanesulfonate monooxygenase SsuD/methylene tetrahydromethanopterin reductase-like flavin-dependent oxidoreductase (luciferase family)